MPVAAVDDRRGQSGTFLFSGDGSPVQGKAAPPRDGHRPPRQTDSLPKVAGCNFSAHAAPRSESLPRARIIRRRTVFDATRNKGRRVSNRHMILNFLSRDAMPPGETGSVAFLTPKRLGAATVRNLLRRRMREIYRRELAQPRETAYLIWIARPPAVELSVEELRTCMAGLLARRRG